MTLREDDVRPIFIDDFQAVAAEQGTLIYYIETPNGIEIYARRGERVYQLYNRNRSPRRFQSGETARLFARDQLRVRRFAWDCPIYASNPPHLSPERTSTHGDS